MGDMSVAWSNNRDNRVSDLIDHMDDPEREQRRIIVSQQRQIDALGEALVRANVRILQLERDIEAAPPAAEPEQDHPCAAWAGEPMNTRTAVRVLFVCIVVVAAVVYGFPRLLDWVVR